MPKKYIFKITTEEFSVNNKTQSSKTVNYNADIIYSKKKNTVTLIFLGNTYNLTFYQNFYIDSSYNHQLSFNPNIKNCSFSSSFGSGILRTTTYIGTITKVVESDDE
jgi:hypothetical protein